MKKKIVLLTITLLTFVLVLSACSQWDTPYENLDDDGNSISVKFLANGGMFAGTNGVTVVDVFALDTSKSFMNIKLLTPDDGKRGNNAFEISNSGYSLEGWYVVNGVRKNANGEELDSEGNVAAVSGKPVAYELGKKWDFASDTLQIDTSKKYSSSTPVLTLCAVWVHYFTFNFYAKNEEGVFEQIDTEQTLRLEYPTWSEKTGTLDSKKYPELKDKTFNGAFYDQAMTQKIEGTITGEVEYDENGIPVEPTPINVYIDYVDGEWYKIYTAAQLNKNASNKGCYELMNDIDFTGAIWPNAFSSREFVGQIKGNGHVISNVNAIQSTSVTRTEFAGLFGAIGDTAVIENVTFENCSFRVNGSIYTQKVETEPGSGIYEDVFVDTYFGLFAGVVSDASTLNNVAINNSKLILDTELCTDISFLPVFNNDKIHIGLVTAEGYVTSVTYSNLTCEHKVESTNEIAGIVINDDGTVNVAFNG